jgi:ribosomal-protein-alanine N-acetyltransferase
MKILIRQLRFSDINQIVKINERSLPENYHIDYWIQKFYESRVHSFVAIGLGEVIGYIFCDEINIISFVIDEKYRSKGIGKQLMYHCLNTYKFPVELHVRINNQHALNLYKSIGFIETEIIKDYYVKPVEDAYTMKWTPTENKFKENKKLNILL